MPVFHLDDVTAATPPPKTATEPPPGVTASQPTDDNSPEAIKQLKSFGKGVLETMQDVTGMMQGNTYAAQHLASGVGGMVSGPLKELAGQPQKFGDIPPRGPADRILGAVDISMGGDPARGRMLEAQGKNWEAAQAYGTIPLLTFGLGKLFEGAVKSYKASPAVAERRFEKRANQLTAATGEGQKKVAELYKQIIPDLENTIKATGKYPNNPTELLKLVNDTSTAKENLYQSLMAPIAKTKVSGSPVAQAIRDKIGVHMQPGDATGETLKMGRDLEEKAKEWDGDFTVEALDKHRRMLFDKEHDTVAGRIAARNKTELMADTAAEDALKDLTYGEVQKIAPQRGLPPDFVRDLKTKQAIIYDIKDVLGPQDISLANKEAIRRGTPLPQRINLTVAAHPDSGRLVASAHGVKDAIAGNPKSLKSASNNIQRAFPTKPPSTSATGKRITATAAAGAIPSKIGTVRMQAPDGTSESVPADQVEHYKSLGATVIQ